MARDVDARHAEVAALMDEVIADAASRLAATSRDAGTLRWNPSPFEREGIPGLGWKVVPSEVAGLAQAPVALHVEGDRIILEDGTALWLTDEDDVGDLYTFCPPEGGLPVGPAVLEMTGPGRVTARFPGSSVSLSIIRRAGEPFVRVEGVLDNGRPDHRLRVWVGLRRSPEGSTALVPFEIVDRPLVGEGYADEAGSPTWPARGAVLAAETALLAEGVIEYQVADDALVVSLVRATGIIAHPTLATRPVWAGPPTITPEAQCLGETRFSLGVWQGAAREGLVEMWERFALPILDVATPGGGTAVGGSLMEVVGAQLSSIRRVAGAIEVRIWNDASAPRMARVAGRDVPLGPARIETILLDGGRVPSH